MMNINKKWRMYSWLESVRMSTAEYTVSKRF